MEDGQTSGLRLDALVFDALDPHRLAHFWAAALQWTISDESPAQTALVPTDDTSFRLVFRPTLEAKSGQNLLHLDLTTTSIADQDSLVERLILLGGSHVDIGQDPSEAHVVLADPEGNELCIIEPENNFLADCGRFGSINCDGTQAVGYFWSEALGWPLVWDQNEETAIRSPDGTGPLITWSGPPLMQRIGRSRLRLDLAPTAGCDHAAEVDRLVSIGARRLDEGHGAVDSVGMADPDGNEFSVLRSR